MSWVWQRFNNQPNWLFTFFSCRCLHRNTVEKEKWFQHTLWHCINERIAPFLTILLCNLCFCVEFGGRNDLTRDSDFVFKVRSNSEKISPAAGQFLYSSFWPTCVKKVPQKARNCVDTHSTKNTHPNGCKIKRTSRRKRKTLAINHIPWSMRRLNSPSSVGSGHVDMCILQNAKHITPSTAEAHANQTHARHEDSQPLDG